MKKIMLNKNLKNIVYILEYWVVFVIIPYFVAVLLISYLYSNPIKFLDYLPGYTMLYLLLLAPFLYIIPYKLAKPKSKSTFIFLGLVLPYLFLYIFVYLYFKANFHPSF
jgi:hypothetical protein